MTNDIVLDEKMIKQVANNASLNLSDEEILSFKEDFKSILDNFSKLESFDTDAKPSFHPLDLKNKQREDIITPSLNLDQALKNVKDKQDGFIRGPRIV